MAWRREMTIAEVSLDSDAEISPKVRASPLCQSFVQNVRMRCGRPERCEPYAGSQANVVVRKSFIEIEDGLCRSSEAVTRSAPGTPLALFGARESPVAAMLLGVSASLVNFAVTKTPKHFPSTPMQFSSLACVDEACMDEAIDEAERWSVGSELHALGECKPCGFFWSARGCHNGRECQHCHLCDESVRKTRKKDCASAKKRRARNRGKAGSTLQCS